MAILDSDLPPTDAAVIGERKDDPDQLLLLGENGAYYAYSIPTDSIAPIEPDESWAVENTDSESLFL